LELIGAISVSKLSNLISKTDGGLRTEGEKKQHLYGGNCQETGQETQCIEGFQGKPRFLVVTSVYETVKLKDQQRRENKASHSS
jgi:hypothetical protein